MDVESLRADQRGSYAYVEFAEPSIVQNALVLNESMFRGRLLMVSACLVPSPCRLELLTHSIGQGEEDEFARDEHDE